jgi:adenylate cyclase
MHHSSAARTLLDSLGEAASIPSFTPLVRGIRDVLRAADIPVDRLQVPMSRRAGFRHPTLAAIVATWCHDLDYGESFVLAHHDFDAGNQPPRKSPYSALFEQDRPYFRVRLDGAPTAYPLLTELEARGYQDYCAVKLQLPEGFQQPMSIATLGQFPDDLEARLTELMPFIALAVYGGYRTSQAIRLARAYIGPRSGMEVLAGQIRRGDTKRLTAGILFCDIRGFTALSERLAPEAVVATVNEVFTLVEAEAATRGGEILKFIGDAMLLVFPVDDSPDTIARAMVDTARQSLVRVAQSDVCVGIGFGGHLGEVIQGNVGTPERIDFTVMGPAVNLASRLEGLCRPLGASAVFSRAVAVHVPDLLPAGARPLKGIRDPVPVYRLDARTSSGLPATQAGE